MRRFDPTAPHAALDAERDRLRAQLPGRRWALCVDAKDRSIRPTGSRGPLLVCAVLYLVGLALVGGCGSSVPAAGRAEPSIEQDLLRGVREIRETRDRKELRAALVDLVAHLRRAHGKTASARRGRQLALQGFTATLEGTKSQIEFSDNDSGEVAEATKDAKRADRYLRRGATLLRAAGRALGIRVGELNGY